MDIRRFIAPLDTNIADVLVPHDESGWVAIDEDGMALVKVLWTSAQTGEWAVLFHWKKGYLAPAHKHLGSIHVYVVSGRLRVRDTVIGAGDYMHEPNGIIHDVTEALEDTVQLNIADGPIVFFDDAGISHYAGWEQFARMAPR